MKTTYLLLTVIIMSLASCSTFKSGQTPDDVYYSPLKKYTAEEEKKNEKQVTKRSSRVEDDYNYEDRALRMRINNQRRWSIFTNDNEFDYRYNHNCNCNCNNDFGIRHNPNYSWYNDGWNIGFRNNNWNTWNNNIVYFAPARPKYIAPRGGVYSNSSRGNSVYRNRTINNTNTTTETKTGRTGLLNRILNSGTNSNNGDAAPTRSYSPSNSGSGGSGSGGGGSSPRPGRTGG